MMSISSIASSTPSSTDSTCSCHNCGAAQFAQLEAQKRIEELEQQVKEYSLKAAQAADSLEHSHAEIIQLKRQSAASQQEAAAAAAATTIHPSSPPRPTTSAASRISAFLTRSSTTITTSTPPPPLPTQTSTQLYGRNLSPEPPEHTTTNTTTSTTAAPQPARSNTLPVSAGPSLYDIEKQLLSERSARENAEKQLAAVKGELEELSVSLFQQANEMVATERRARAKLEERIAHLEKRDMEKGARLERLEKALQRINRVRDVLSSNPTY